LSLLATKNDGKFNLTLFLANKPVLGLSYS